MTATGPSRAVGHLLKAQIGRPIASNNAAETARKVRWIYKEWMRFMPDLWHEGKYFDMPLPHLKLLIKNQFLKNKGIMDVRIIDRLLHFAVEELKETKNQSNQWYHIRNYLLKDNIEPKATDFLSQFLAGKK